MEALTVWQVVCACSIPSILMSALIALIAKCINACKALKLGVQAMLRSQLVTMYEEYSKKGSAPLHVKDNFMNVYAQYHALGANGVIDSIKDKFMDLPIN